MCVVEGVMGLFDGYDRPKIALAKDAAFNFIVMARFEMQRQQWQEEKWLKFSYKRKKKDSDQ